MLWLETKRISKAGERQITAAQTAATAAENAVAESAKMLVHAREIAEREFRPWLTLQATLASNVMVDPSEEGGIAFFIDLRCTNVGKVVAQDIIYGLRGVDLTVKPNLNEWFTQLIEDAVWDSKMTRDSDGRQVSNDRIVDSLVPSEVHSNRMWCRVPAPEGDEVQWYGLPEKTHM